MRRNNLAVGLLFLMATGVICVHSRARASDVKAEKSWQARREVSDAATKRINTSFPHWFCHNFKKYKGKENRLPVDQCMDFADRHFKGAELSLRDRKDIVFSCDFESDKWYEQFGMRSRPQRVDAVSSDPARKFEPLAGRAMRIKIDRDGHYGTSILYRFKDQIGTEPQEIYFRYYLRFADDWDPAGGGKLPGISGTYGRAGWGGRPSNGRNGWSARGLFKKQVDGKTPVGYYCYHADMKGRYGSDWIWDTEKRGYLQNNRWYCIEQYVKMNTPGKTDGILRGWVDGQPAFEKTDVRMRDVDTLKIEAVWLNVYLGGSWVARSDHHLYIDKVVIAHDYIGSIQ